MFISIAFGSACALNVFMFSRETPKKFWPRGNVQARCA